MNKPWHRLNINIDNAIVDITKLDTFDQSRSSEYWILRDEEIYSALTHEWCEYMTSLGYKPIGVAIFFKKSNEGQHKNQGLHIDAYDTEKGPVVPVYGINWIMSEHDEGEMVWYDTERIADKLQAEPTVHPSNQALYYRYHAIENLKEFEISRCCIGAQPTLVSIGIPHSVLTPDDQKYVRWSISVRFEETKETETWDDVVNDARSKGLII